MSFLPVETGTYEFTLTVTDPCGVSDDATVFVFVGDDGALTCAHADAGIDQTVSEGSAVTLRGGNSADPSGGALTYEWNQLSGTQVSISGVFTAEPGFAAPQVTGEDVKLVFELRVTNEQSCSDTDTIVVTVQDRDPNDPCADVSCDDDELFCNGFEFCDDGLCASTGDPCNAIETCNELADSCEAPECNTDADCDDTDACTEDDCVDHTCRNTRIPECCREDADCDDAEFCNGVEICNTDTGMCEPGTDPCAEGKTCDEDTDKCGARPLLINADFAEGLEGWSVGHREWLECGGSATVTWSQDYGGSARLTLSGSPGSISIEQPMKRAMEEGERIFFVVCQSDMANFGHWSIVIWPPGAYNDVGIDPEVHHTCSTAVSLTCRDQTHDCPQGAQVIVSSTEPPPGGFGEGCHTIEFVASEGIEPGSWIDLHAVVWPGSASVWFQGVFTELCVEDSDCDDGLFCNGAETCEGGRCVPGTPVNCDDDVACTDDSCNESTDSCDNTANDSNCDDGDPCTDDACIGGQCENTPGGCAWTKMNPDPSPAPRSGHAMAYDAGRQETILFAGWLASNPSCGCDSETWAWDGETETWTLVTAEGPSARYGHAMAYDTARGVVLLFGGWPFTPDTWEWDGTNWIEQFPQANPGARYNHAMAYDAGRDRIVLFGGQIFCPEGGCPFVGDTWEWDGTTWTQVHAPDPTGSDAPIPRWAHAMAYDSDRGVVVLFGGQDMDQTYLNDTWTWDGTSWNLAHPGGPNAPAPRGGHAMTFDTTRRRVILFGGSGGSNYGDTWEWNGNAWTMYSAGGPDDPSPRRGHAMTYDSANATGVLFGGYDNARNNETWVFGPR